MLKAAVIGATGYSGEQLVYLLAGHPEVELIYVSGKEDRAEKIQDIFPRLQGVVDLPCNAFSPKDALAADVIFLALPHRVSMRYAGYFLDKKKQVIDIGADFRFKDVHVFERFYGCSHESPELLKKTVYGLPEWNRSSIESADLIGNPGCYPTATILSLLPLFSSRTEIASTIIIDAKSGATGAGRNASKALLFSEVNESFKGYKLAGHQHEGEIHSVFQSFGIRNDFVFAPHLLPCNRGILATIYVPMTKGADYEGIRKSFEDYYASEPFVRVYPEGRLPQLSEVTHTNYCHLGLVAREHENMLIIVSVIDNLMKGASGQAVQNMNIRNGFRETAGLI